MKKQGEKSLTEVILTVVVGVFFVLAFEFSYPYFASFFNIPASYDIYVKGLFGAVIIGILALIILRIVKRVLDRISARSNGERNLNGIFILIRIIIYAIAIFTILAYIGVNLAGAIEGGAIGGIVLGLAVQSVASSFLSGIMVTAGGFLKPEESISIYSWMFPETLTGKVEDVKTLYTRVRLLNSRSILIPNTILFGQALFTKLNEGRKIRYQVNATLPADTNAFEIMESLKGKKEKIVSDLGLQEMDIFLSAKNGTTNTILFNIQFEDVMLLNKYIDTINQEVEKSYWEIKNKPKT
jgi:small-conductance mechanosensitive channel